MHPFSVVTSFWRRLVSRRRPAALDIPGLWDANHQLRTYSENINDWRNEVLLCPRRDPLVNGVVVTQVAHLNSETAAEGSDASHCLRIDVLHEATKQKISLLVVRNTTGIAVQRGAKDAPSRKSTALQTLAFPPCARPPIINLAFILSTLANYSMPPAESAPDGFQAYWFARAACDCFHSELKGKLSGYDSKRFQLAALEEEYTSPVDTVLAEYRKRLDQYLAAFEGIQGGKGEQPVLGIAR